MGDPLIEADLAGLPASLVVADGDTYGLTETFGDNTQTTYFDGTGTILGLKPCRRTLMVTQWGRLLFSVTLIGIGSAIRGQIRWGLVRATVPYSRQ